MNEPLIVYSYPVLDNREDTPEWTTQLHNDVHRVRNVLLGTDCKIVDLGRAWLFPEEAEPDPRVVEIVRQTIRHADGLFAYMPSYSLSLAQPMEVALASELGLPVWVVCAESEWALMRPGVRQFQDWPEAIDSLNSTNWDIKTRGVETALWTASQETAKAPTRAHADDAGWDLYYCGTSDMDIRPGAVADVPAGLAIQWPHQMWGLLVGRSSTFRTKGLLVNTAIIDAGFRGELFAIVRNISDQVQTIQPGDRIAQVIPLPTMSLRMDMAQVSALANSERGTKGFGSSGS